MIAAQLSPARPLGRTSLTRGRIKKIKRCYDCEHACPRVRAAVNLLVWLITEVVTDGPKSAGISVCSLHRTDGRDNEKLNVSKSVCFLLSFMVHLISVCLSLFFLIVLFFVSLNVTPIFSILNKMTRFFKPSCVTLVCSLVIFN